MHPEPDWPSLMEQTRLRLRGTARPQDVDDAVEDAVVAAWEYHAAGHLHDALGFCLVVARRRLADQGRRRRGCFTTDSESLAELAAAADAVAVDWDAKLREQGALPTANWCRILELLASGVRSSKALARVLGRDVKSVKESRRRLQRWLQGLASPPRERPSL